MTNRSNAFAARLLEQLDETLAHGTVARRAQMLRSITDLFLAGGGNDYADDQLAVFDDVFTVLVQNMEVSAKALLANRLAPHPAAPPRIVHALAFDVAIEVAEPVLTHSTRLGDDALIENARTRSQAHLLAISRRTRLSDAVTDVLVDRGNEQVVTSAAGNPGAEFSETGYAKLVEWAQGNDDLAACVGLRPGIPRHHLLKLIARASDAVLERLQTAHPDHREAINAAVRQVVVNAQNQSAAGNDDVLTALRLIDELHDAGQLNETRVAQFASGGRFNETNAALARLTNVPFATVEAMMVESRSEGMMALAKVCDFAWPTVKTILNMRSRLQGAVGVDEAFTRVTYERLKPATAHQVLRFDRMQQQLPPSI